VRLHQVTRQEYNELLRLTQGKEEVSEARLLSSSIAGIKGLASGLAAYPQPIYNPQPQPPIGPYPPPIYGSNGYPYLDLQALLAQENAIKDNEKAEADDDLESDEDSYESEDEDDYRYKKRYYSQKPLYLQETYNN